MNKITRIFILGSVFLVPLVFWPGGRTDLAKQTLLVVGIGLVGLAFLMGEGVSRFSLENLFQERERMTRLDWLVLTYLGVGVVSTFLSRWPWGSFWGWPQSTTGSLLTWLGFAGIYFLASRMENPRGVILALLGAAGLVGLMGIVGLIRPTGLLRGNIRPTGLLRGNPVGTFNAWGLFLAGLTPLVLMRPIRPIRLILIVFLFAGVVLINYWLAWLVLGLGMIVVVMRRRMRQRALEKASSTLGRRIEFLVLGIGILALLLGIFRISIPGLPPTLIEVLPSLRATLAVSRQMIGAMGQIRHIGQIRDLLLGWGPGTFGYGWSRYRSAALNQTLLWNVRFNRGGSEILELIGETGILGIVSFLSLMTVGLGRVGRQRFKEDSALAAAFLTFSVVKFLYPANFTLSFTWWLLLGMLGWKGRPEGKETKRTNMGASKEGLVSLLGPALLTLMVLILFYFQGQRLRAEIEFLKALRALEQGRGREVVIGCLKRALIYNRHQEVFLRQLSQLYLSSALEQAGRTDLPQERRQQRVSVLVGGAVTAAKRATEINSVNVANWQMRGQIYRNLIGFSSGAFKWALRCFERARELEPSNPFLPLEVARIYLAQASVSKRGPERSNYLKKAEEEIEKSLALKPNYAPAFFQQALIYEMGGKREEAITTLERLKDLAGWIPGYNPLQDVGLAFQLGVLYYRSEQWELSRAEFERAVELSPNYSNARYFLGLIYDRQDKKQKAIEQFERIAELNPKNEEVKAILENLWAGKPAFEGIAPIEEEVPIEEKPE